MHRRSRTLSAPLIIAAAFAAPAAAAAQDLLALVRPEPRRTPEFPQLLVSPAEAAERLAAGAVAVDARPASEGGRGYLPGSVRPEITDSCIAAGADCIRERLAAAGLSGLEEVILYGAGPAPGGVGRLFWLLEWAGFREVTILEGGTAAWQREGLPLEPGLDPRPPTRPAAPAAAGVAVDADWLAERCGTSGTEVLDLRGAAAWGGAPGHGVPPGHVPDSLPFDPAALLPEGGGWPDPSAARRAFGGLGPRPGTPLDVDATFALYDHGPEGHRLGTAYLLLRLLDVSVRVYPEGWRGWTAEAGRPVVRIVDAEGVRRRLEASNPRLAEDRPTDDVVLLDLRGELDYEAAHLPGAHRLSPGDCSTLADDIGPPAADGGDRPVSLIFYCYGVDCIRSRYCSTLAARSGFEEVLWFREGLPGWLAAGLPVFSTPGAILDLTAPDPR